MSLTNFLKPLKHKKFALLVTALIALGGSAIITTAAPNVPIASAADECTTGNNIMRNGTGSTSSFISQVQGSSELQHIYADGRFGNGLTSSQYADFKANAKHGYTDRSGGVYLDNGTKVASGAGSIGRDAGCQGSSYSTFKISGAGTYYGNSNSKSIAAGTSDLGVWILLNSDGKATFAVMTNCGNPLYFPSPPTPTPPKPPTPPAPTPSYSCVQLAAPALVNNTNNTYNFTVTASYKNATPTSADFVVKTGSSSKTYSVSMKSTDLTATFQHMYGAVTGSSSVSAILHFTANGKSVATAQSAKCSQTVNLTLPYCSGLSGPQLSSTNVAQFTATAVTNGRKLAYGVFDFGDNTPLQHVNATTANTVSVSHPYNSSGPYNATATLYFTGTNNAQLPPPTACKALVSVTITPECKPNVPVGDVRCNPCPSNPAYSASDTEHCVVPQATLPNTGAGDTIAIFSAVVIGGFIIYRQLLFRQHKAAFVAAEQGTSYLPLADPLAEDDPLRDTPLAPKQSSFRRKRQY